MLNAFASLKCSKKSQRNVQKPIHILVRRSGAPWCDQINLTCRRLKRTLTVRKQFTNPNSILPNLIFSCLVILVTKRPGADSSVLFSGDRGSPIIEMLLF